MTMDEDIAEEQDNYLEDNSHQACYVFKSLSEQNDFPDPRPTKKRKVIKTITGNSIRFPLLLNGIEHEDHAQRREQAFARLWAEKEARLDQIANDLNQTTLSKFKSFVQKSDDDIQSDRLPMAILTSNSQSNVQDRFLDEWNASTQPNSDHIVVNLRPSQCTNLQNTLKNIIKIGIAQSRSLEYYNEFLNKHKRLIPMNFDLELLQIFAKENNTRVIIVSALDVETFEMTVINDMIAMLHSWSDRLPFVLVIGLATTTDLFESRLPKSTLGLLKADYFELNLDFDPIYRIFKACQTEETSKLFLGPSVSNALLESAENQNLTPRAFIQAIKYVYMSHFFSNPLSVLLHQAHLNKSQDLKVLCEAVRHCDSFRTYCEEAIEKDHTKQSDIKKLLENDEFLIVEAMRALEQGQNAFLESSRVISALAELYQMVVAPTPASTSNKPNDSAFSTEVQLYQTLSDLTSSTIYYSIESALRKLSSTALLETLSKCSAETLETLDITTLPALQTSNSKRKQVEHVTSPSKSKASKPKASNSSPTKTNKNTHDKAHLDHLNDMLSNLESIVHQHSFPPPDSASSSLIPFCSESYLFKMRQPLHASVIAPRPRHAIERALAKPADYLGCEHQSCAGSSSHNNSEADTIAMQPPSALLYDLLTEAGALVNVLDLFEAFKARLAGRTDDSEKDGASEQRAKALFYTALSELKYVGLVKAGTTGVGTGTQVKKKKTSGKSDANAEVELIAKTSWFGL